MDNIDYKKLEEAEKNLTKQLLDEKRERDVTFKEETLYKAGSALVSISVILLLNLTISAFLFLSSTGGRFYYLIIIMGLLSSIAIIIKFYQAGVHLKAQGSKARKILVRNEIELNELIKKKQNKET